MADQVPDLVYDAALAKIAEATEAHLCTSAPANHAGISAVSLGSATVTAGDGNGDWTIAAGDATGRKVTLAEQTGITIGGSGGTVTHVAYTDGSELKYVTELDTGKSYDAADEATIPEYDVLEIADPT